MDEFLIRAGLAGIAMALAAGPLGCFIVWRRMAYFGDATAHAAILGVALALMADLPILLGTAGAALAMALLVSRLVARGHGMDTALGVIAHGALAVGLLALYTWGGAAIRVESYLFGEILLVGWRDLAMMYAGAAVVLALLIWRWQRLVTATLSEDLAHSSGIDPETERVVITVALALVVALALKAVGALLIGSMLIIPAAAARGIARGPEAMAVLAVALGALSALGGLGLSVWLDAPAGPAIVTVALVIFVLSLLPRRH